MKYAIIYSSVTGNTKYLAEALKHKLKKVDCVICETQKAENVDADVYFVGFWTFRGKCDIDTEQFLEGLRNKKLFLFGTAGFGESSSYYKKILQRTAKVLDNSVNLVGSFMCQGRLSKKVREKYEKMMSSFLYRFYARWMIKNYDSALNHPDEQDLDQLYLAVKDAFADLEF